MTPKVDEPITHKIHRTVVRSLPCRLTDEELLKKGADLATARVMSDSERQQALPMETATA